MSKYRVTLTRKLNRAVVGTSCEVVEAESLELAEQRVVELWSNAFGGDGYTFELLVSGKVEDDAAVTWSETYDVPGELRPA